MRKLYLSSVTYLLILLIPVLYTHGADKTAYFGRLLSSWGIDVYIINENIETKELELPGNDSEDFFLLTTNQMAELKMNLNALLKYDKVILVCDKIFVLSNDISCGFDNITTTLQKIELAADKSNSVLNTSLNGTNLIVIPEAGFVLPKNTIETTAYFEALDVSKESKKKDKNHTDDESMKEPPAVLTENFELISYLTLLLVLNLIIAVPLKKLIKTNNVTLIKAYNNQLIKLKNFINVYTPISKYLVTLGICGNILVGAVFLLDDGISLLKDTLKVLLTTPALTELADLEIWNSKYALVLFMANTLLIGALSPLLIEKLITHISIKTFLPAHRLQKDIAKWLLTILVVAGIITVATGTIIEVHHTLIALLLMTMYIIITSNNFSFTHKEKILAISIILTVASGAPLYNYYSNEISTYTTEETLFSDSEKFVLLPYRKNIYKSISIKDFATSIDFPIFVENHLIYHPMYEKVINRNIKDLDLTKNYIIVTMGKKEYIKTLLTYPILLEQVETENISEFFYGNKNIGQTDSVKVRLTINCEVDTAATELYLEKYKLDTDTEQFNLLIFPGCAPLQNEMTYEAPIDTRYMQQPGIFHIQNFSKIYITSVSLIINDKEEKLNYIKAPKDYQIVDSKIFYPNSDEIYVYSQKNNTETIYNNNEIEPNLNITPLINKAVETLEIKDNFLMWSSAENAIIRNVQ